MTQATDQRRRAGRTRTAPAATVLAGAALVWLTCGAGPLMAQTQSPLSASDWLSGSVSAPPRAMSGWRPGDPMPPDAERLGAANAAKRPPIPPVARSGAVGAVTVKRLDDTDANRAGTQSAQAAGLPADLWQGSDGDEIAQLIARTPTRLPAMGALMRRLATAQLAPPGDGADTAAASDALFLARADRLLDMGDVAAARALLRAAGPGDPERFRRLFDIALLQGDEDDACRIMSATPGIAPSFAARIFCLARSGDWPAAAVVLRGAEALGRIDPTRADLLSQFLDNAEPEPGDRLVPPMPVTPLDFRMFEAVGQPLPTTGMPLAFAHSDLRPTNGWKARLEAAERIARAGTMPAADLHALYTEQRPAASGGVWERASAFQALMSEFEIGPDPGPTLRAAVEEFGRVDLTHALAAMLADRLPALAAAPPGIAPATAREAARLIGWLGQTPPAATLDALPPSRIDATPPPAPPQTARGAALLRAMADVDAGLDGDTARAGRGLAMLQALGFETDAQAARLQLDLMLAQAAQGG